MDKAKAALSPDKKTITNPIKIEKTNKLFLNFKFLFKNNNQKILVKTNKITAMN